MTRVRLELDRAEYRGLARLAELELRPVSDQARFMIREALKRDGLLANETQAAVEAPREESRGGSTPDGPKHSADDDARLARR